MAKRLRERESPCLIYPPRLEMAKRQRRLGRCYYRRRKNNISRLMDLSTEIFNEILSRLPISCLFRVRCVSKASKERVDCPSFVAQHTRCLLSALATYTMTNTPSASVLSVAHNQVPMLMLVDDSISTSGFAFTPLKNDGSNNALTRREDATVPAIQSTELNAYYSLGFVFCNLFFFFDHTHNIPKRKRVEYRSPCFLFNPLKGEVLPLPTTDIQIPLSYPMRHDMFKEWFAMGFDNVNNTYKIVRVSGDATSDYNLIAQVYVLGTSSWREIPSVPPCNLSDKHAFAYGDQHWLVSLPADHSVCKYRSVLIICSFDFNKEEFYWITPPEHMQKMRLWRFKVPDHLHLLNLRGFLAIVDTSSDNDYIEIWVLKSYDKKEWKLDYKIDKAVLGGRKLINRSCSEWEHGIFFTFQNCLESTRDIVFLDLRCGSLNQVKLSPPRTTLKVTSILSYYGTLISLKHYGNLVEPEPITESTISFETFFNLIIG